MRGKQLEHLERMLDAGAEAIGTCGHHEPLRVLYRVDLRARQVGLLGALVVVELPLGQALLRLDHRDEELSLLRDRVGIGEVGRQPILDSLEGRVDAHRRCADARVTRGVCGLGGVVVGIMPAPILVDDDGLALFTLHHDDRGLERLEWVGRQPIDLDDRRTIFAACHVDLTRREIDVRRIIPAEQSLGDPREPLEPLFEQMHLCHPQASK
jgi:hypothetical protein